MFKPSESGMLQQSTSGELALLRKNLALYNVPVAHSTIPVKTRSRYFKDRIDFQYELCSENDQALYTREELNPNSSFNCIEVGLIQGKVKGDYSGISFTTKQKIGETIINSVEPYIGKLDKRSAIEFAIQCERKIMAFLEVDSHKTSIFLSLLKGEARFWADRCSKGKRYRNLRDDFINEFYDIKYQKEEARKFFNTVKYPEYEGQLVSGFVSDWLNKLEFNSKCFWDIIWTRDQNSYEKMFEIIPPIYKAFLADHRRRYRSRTDDYDLIKRICNAEQFVK